jgi:hypothetical protein
MIAGGLACLVHGVAPALFTSTGSQTVARLHRRIFERRDAAARVNGEEPTPR